MMNPSFPALLCFLAMPILATEAQAATPPLEPYLVVSTATPPIDVSFSYVPASTAADYPTLRLGTGKLYTKNMYSQLFLYAYDNAYSGNSSEGYGEGYIGGITPFDGKFTTDARGGTSYTSCDMPLIPIQGVTGMAFPIVRSVTTMYRCDGITTPPAHTVSTFLVSYHAPTVVTVADGNRIESVKISVLRDGAPWASYYFGYRIGLFRMEADPAMTTIFYVPELNALTLPPPTTEGTVVEYSNTADFPLAPGGHFFYSSDALEQQFVDSGQAGHFQRTGRSFNAGGYVPVCRFYGSQSPGPNSHFFSADQNECAGLKAMQKTPIPTDTPQWNSEGNGFYTVAVVAGGCLAGTVPVYRAYNNAYTNDGKRNPWDSNHRFSTSRADIDQMSNQGWADEGIAFCAPS